VSKAREDDALVTVGQYFSAAEAHAHRLALEEAGIDACVLDEVAVSIGIGVGVRLQVKAADEAAAVGVLEAEPVPGSALPRDVAEPPCPKCGSTEVTQTAEIPEIPPPPVEDWPSRVWRFRCAVCKHSWLDDESATKSVN